MLLGVGSANTDGMRIGVGSTIANTISSDEAIMWVMKDGTIEENIPVQRCFEAQKNGYILDSFPKKGEMKSSKALYDGSLYTLIMIMVGGTPSEIFCWRQNYEFTDEKWTP